MNHAGTVVDRVKLNVIFALGQVILTDVVLYVVELVVINAPNVTEVVMLAKMMKMKIMRNMRMSGKYQYDCSFHLFRKNKVGICQPYFFKY